MRENINKVSQRGERLDSLQDKTDNLAVSAQGFRRGANRVRKQMWWKDMKMRVCLVICIIILIIVIVVPAGKSQFLLPFPWRIGQFELLTCWQLSRRSTESMHTAKLFFWARISFFSFLIPLRCIPGGELKDRCLPDGALSFWSPLHASRSGVNKLTSDDY